MAAFQDEKSAKEALKMLKEAKHEKLIDIVDAAVLRKDAKGKLHIHETADTGGAFPAARVAAPMLLVPAAAFFISKQLESFKEFPPRQEAPSFNVDKMIAQMNKASDGSMHEAFRVSVLDFPAQIPD